MRLEQRALAAPGPPQKMVLDDDKFSRASVAPCLGVRARSLCSGEEVLLPERPKLPVGQPGANGTAHSGFAAKPTSKEHAINKTKSPPWPS